MEDSERLRRVISLLLDTFKLKGAFQAGSPYANLNLTDLAVLKFLGEEGPKIMRDVAAHLAAPVSTATSIADRLVRQGLVERARSEENRRIVRVAITPKGRQLFDFMVAGQRDNCRRILEILDPDERPQLLALLGKIAAAGAEKARAKAD